MQIHSDLPDSSDLVVTVAHPFGDVEVALDEWIKRGPGGRNLMDVSRLRTTKGEELPLRLLPLRYRNSRPARVLRRLGLLTDPWDT